MEEYFKKLTDLFVKFQAVLFLVLILCLLLSIFSNGCQRNDIIALTEKLIKIKLENKFLISENSEKKKYIQKLKIDSICLTIKYDSVLSLKNGFSDQVSTYKLQLSDLRKKFIYVSEDSSYNWLQAVGYPFGAEYRPYKFNGQQVRAIHIDKIESVTKDSLISNLDKELVKTEELLVLKDSMFLNKSEESAVFAEANRNLETISGNKDDEIRLKDKELRKERRAKAFWKVTTAISSIGGLILAII